MKAWLNWIGSALASGIAVGGAVLVSGGYESILTKEAWVAAAVATVGAAYQHLRDRPF